MYNKCLLDEMVDKFDSPIYLYDTSEIEKQIMKLKYTLGKNIEIAYSIKANPNTQLVKFIASKVYHADVVSIQEIKVALANGFLPENILFIGPVKKEREICEAIKLGIQYFVCESKEEVQIINKYSKSKCKIILRINPKMGNRKAGIQMTGKASKFGIDEDKIIPTIRDILKLKKVNFVGLHMYIGTQILDASTIIENFEYLIMFFLKCEKEIGVEFPFLGFGGGYGIPYYENEKEIDLEYMKIRIEFLLHKYPSILNKKVVTESGRFLVGTCGSYIMRVQRVKESIGHFYAITDGGLNHHSAACGIGRFVRRSFPLYAPKKVEKRDMTYEIVGRLCTPMDSFGIHKNLPILNSGDILVIPNAGAYCINMSPLQFLGFPAPNEIVI